MHERRELTFASLDEVWPEVERLLAGHETVGAWSLAQICNHLATGLRLTVDESAPPGSRIVPEAVRRRFFRSGRFPDGVAAPDPILLPAPGLDERTEADSLRAVLARFASSDGPFFAHPALGPLSKDEWSLFHRMHCAHHLGFAVPTAADERRSSLRGG